MVSFNGTDDGLTKDLFHVMRRWSFRLQNANDGPQDEDQREDDIIGDPLLIIVWSDAGLALLTLLILRLLWLQVCLTHSYNSTQFTLSQLHIFTQIIALTTAPNTTVELDGEGNTTDAVGHLLI